MNLPIFIIYNYLPPLNRSVLIISLTDVVRRQSGHTRVQRQDDRMTGCREKTTRQVNALRENTATPEYTEQQRPRTKEQFHETATQPVQPSLCSLFAQLLVNPLGVDRSEFGIRDRSTCQAYVTGTKLYNSAWHGRFIDVGSYGTVY